ncbi:tripartite tricarboxylate transporter TctB family protein [Aminobacter sp. NyZ550]|jgi:putative tricarboxylic transport membrane protein|uniref:tripartite tricarboxylate transporter TctB family protein n=1 Tax=Aminobacter TaxID=31988 RepID=UPI00177C52AC|nr:MULTISPECIES: tripartite tricarboxylate transporter TctB family protein [unclassified Aminobacter]QOF73514.1 tripartite tricarboxylate transporter TctB family protein [Aminobacter sp. SR38]WAX95330.1 tripartite tricarboxylate transporter TctB family protein [Aminobacter sp. NyZ550]WMC97737.1 tripartite tricarboxylate transporter TctB family protein [Aminobacter aminovorans]
MSLDNQQQERRRPDRAALVIAALLMVVSLVIAWSTASHGAGANYARVGPTTFPYVIAVAFFGLSIWTFFEAWRGDFPEREKQEISPILWIVGGLAAQMLLLKTAGFSIATGLLFAATASAFGRGPLWKTIPIGIVLSFVVWIIFAKGLQLSLPAGPLEHLLF